MALDPEIVELILKVTGSASIEEATGKLRALKETYQTLDRQVGEYALAEEKSTRAMDEAVRKAVEETQARKAMNQVLEESIAEQERLATVVTTTSTRTGQMGQTILQTSYAVQDFTSQLGTRGLAGGLAAVQNNIPGILAGLGMGAGVAGAVSLVAVGLGAAVPLLSRFAEAEDDATESTKKLANEVERLKNLQTPEAKEEKARVEQFLAFGPPEEVLKGIRTALGRRSARMSMAPQEGEIEEQVKQLFTGMAGDAGIRERVRVLAGESEDVFPTGFAADLGTFGPEAEREADAELEAAESFGERARRGGAGRRRNAAEQTSRRRRMERNLDRATDDAIRNEESLEEQAKQETMEAAHGQRQAEQAARQAARDADPSNRLNAVLGQQRDVVTREAMRQWNAGGRRESGPALQGIIADAVRGLPDAGNNVAMAVNAAAQAAYAKAQADMARAMRRQQMLSNQRE